MLAYKLCKAFGCDISTLNSCELTILFGRDIDTKIEDWEAQPDNKFTREQVDILLKQMR